MLDLSYKILDDLISMIFKKMGRTDGASIYFMPSLQRD